MRTALEHLYPTSQVFLTTLSSSGSERPVIEINPNRNNGEKHHYNEVVRNKNERKKLVADTCDGCKAVGPPCFTTCLPHHSSLIQRARTVVRTHRRIDDCRLPRPRQFVGAVQE